MKLTQINTRKRLHMFQAIHNIPETSGVRMVAKFHYHLGGCTVNNYTSTRTIFGNIECFRDGEHEVFHLVIIWGRYTARRVHDKSDVHLTRTTECT